MEPKFTMVVPKRIQFAVSFKSPLLSPPKFYLIIYFLFI